MHTGLKIALGAGLVGGAALLLAACGTSEKDPQSEAIDNFDPFDANGDNEWTSSEKTRFVETAPYYGQTYNTYRIGDMQFWNREVVHRETTHSMNRAYAAAKGNDAIASLQELTNLALRFDTNNDGTLNRTERRNFDEQYGPTSTSRTIRDRVESGWSYIERYPDTGYYPPDYGGGTGTGDDYGNGGYVPDYGGGTGTGDDYGNGGYVPDYGGGTGSGDDYGAGNGGYDPDYGGGSNSGDDYGTGGGSYDPVPDTGSGDYGSGSGSGDEY